MWKRLALLCLLPFLLVGCNDEDCAECPDPAPMPTMDNIWPHEDGTGWVYDLQYREFEGPAPAETAPPLPTLQALHAALAQPLEGDPLVEEQVLYRLRFEGELTTGPGVTAQNLVGTTYRESTPSLSARSDRRLLGLIARARPDLRPRILAEVDGTADDLKDASGASMYSLGSCAFASEQNGYYAYGELDAEHSWIFLEGDLSIGSEFTLQLVPELADDIWLYGQIWGVGDKTVDGVTWSNVLECMYAVDMGVQAATDDQGNLLGEYRSYLYFATLYAPGYGPIMSVERQVLAAGSVLQDWESIVREFRCTIER